MKTSTACLSPRNLKQSLRDGKGRRSKVAKKRITYKLYHLRKCTVLNEDFSISLAFRRGPFAKVNYNWVFHCNFNVNMTTSMQKFQKFLHRNHWGSYDFCLQENSFFVGLGRRKYRVLMHCWLLKFTCFLSSIWKVKIITQSFTDVLLSTWIPQWRHFTHFNIGSTKHHALLQQSFIGSWSVKGQTRLL